MPCMKWRNTVWQMYSSSLGGGGVIRSLFSRLFCSWFDGKRVVGWSDVSTLAALSWLLLLTYIRTWQEPTCGMGMTLNPIDGLLSHLCPMNSAQLATRPLPLWMANSLWWGGSWTMAMLAAVFHTLTCNSTAGNLQPLWTLQGPSAWQVEHFRPSKFFFSS